MSISSFYLPLFITTWRLIFPKKMIFISFSTDLSPSRQMVQFLNFVQTKLSISMQQHITTDPLALFNYQDDNAYDEHFLPRIKKLSKMHWSPLPVIQKAAAFLAPDPGHKIIDIGSGAGKFCIAAAHYCPDSEFHGIEHRKQLHLNAMRSKALSKLDNVHFMHGDFTQLNMTAYSGIYFFNSFAENLYTFGRIDNTIAHSASLYNYYANYLYKILEEKPRGTRLASYHVSENEIPLCYELNTTDFNDNLKLWIRQ